MSDFNELKQAFLNTLYVVHFTCEGNDCEVLLKVGQSSDQLARWLAPNTPWAFITAWNPLPEVFSVRENRRRNEQLLQEIQLAQYKVYRGEGRAPDGSWSEESFFVVGISLLDATSLAHCYGQLALLHGAVGEVAHLVFIREMLQDS